MNPLRLLVLIAASVALSVSAQTSDWAGGDGSWSSNGSPGWNGTGVPNAVGAVANFSDATITGNFVTNVDIPATVGTINFNANGNLSRSVNTVSNLTMDNGGSGAVISNSNPSTGTNNFLAINSGQNGNLVLADDLLVTNTGESTAPNDAILIGNLIQGTGNVTFSTVGNTVLSDNNAPGSIRIIQNGSYVGNVLVQKGAVMTNSFQAFGDPGNMVTLGQAGQGSVTVMVTSASGTNINNPFTAAAGTGGTTVLGTSNTASSTFGGNITLNGNLTINSWVTQTGGFNLAGTISGLGGLTFTTSTQVNSGDPTKIISELDTFDSVSGDRNTYTGGTIVGAGTLIAKGNGSLGAGNVSLTASNVQLTMTSNGTDRIADTASLSLLDSTDTLNLNFSASRPEKVGALIINGVAEPIGIYNASNLSEITGTGAIQVLGIAAVPEAQTWVISALTAGVMLTSFFRKKIRGQSVLKQS